MIRSNRLFGRLLRVKWPHANPAAKIDNNKTKLAIVDLRSFGPFRIALQTVRSVRRKIRQAPEILCNRLVGSLRHFGNEGASYRMGVIFAAKNCKRAPGILRCDAKVCRRRKDWAVQANG
jgi:hypothetical protein